MRVFFKRKNESPVQELFEQTELKELLCLVGIFPDGVDDDVLDFQNVDPGEPKKGEYFLLKLEKPEIMLHCLNTTSTKKFNQVLGQLEHLTLSGAPEQQLKEIRIRLVAYASISNATGILMQNRINILLAKHDLEVPEGYAVATRNGFNLYAVPMESLFVIGITSTPKDHSAFPSHENDLCDKDFEEMAKISGVKITETFRKP